ncbi:O-methyltransferase [Mycena amicta]|nr:O-methyltransferase [Mycena amicta]
MSTSPSTLRQLSDLISASVDTIERVYAAAGQPLPSLDAPCNPVDPAEVLRGENPEIEAAVKNLVAASAQISATMFDPMRAVVNASHAFFISSCLLAASDANVVEILREAGPEGAEAKKIAEISSVDADILTRTLRLLATHHIFREVSPGVFANNRVSSALDKGKSTKELFSGSRAERLTGSSGVAALAEHTADLVGKAGVYLSDQMRLRPTKLPMSLAFNTDKSVFDWFHSEPGNEYNVARFAVAMEGTSATEPGDLIFQGFDWGDLPAGSVIIDVGGGIGYVSLAIAKRYPHLHIVNQDMEAVIEISKQHWNEHFPEHVANQKVELQVHDFFTPQNNTAAPAVFLLKYILHDYNDTKAAVILRHLREAASQDTTKLVVVEKIVPFASDSGSSSEAEIQVPGAHRPTAPPPLLSNWGPATADTYLYDMTMHAMLGGTERTLEGFSTLFGRCGWTLVEVHHCAGSQVSQIVAVPI